MCHYFQIVLSLGPDLVAQLVRRMGPGFTTEIVKDFGASFTANLVKHFGSAAAAELSQGLSPDPYRGGLDRRMMAADATFLAEVPRGEAGVAAATSITAPPPTGGMTPVAVATAGWEHKGDETAIPSPGTSSPLAAGSPDSSGTTGNQPPPKTPPNSTMNWPPAGPSDRASGSPQDLHSIGADSAAMGPLAAGATRRSAGMSTAFSPKVNQQSGGAPASAAPHTQEVVNPNIQTLNQTFDTDATAALPPGHQPQRQANERSQPLDVAYPEPLMTVNLTAHEAHGRGHGAEVATEDLPTDGTSIASGAGTRNASQSDISNEGAPAAADVQQRPAAAGTAPAPDRPLLPHEEVLQTVYTENPGRHAACAAPLGPTAMEPLSAAVAFPVADQPAGAQDSGDAPARSTFESGTLSEVDWTSHSHVSGFAPLAPQQQGVAHGRSSAARHMSDSARSLLERGGLEQQEEVDRSSHAHTTATAEMAPGTVTPADGSASDDASYDRAGSDHGSSEIAPTQLEGYQPLGAHVSQSVGAAAPPPTMMRGQAEGQPTACTKTHVLNACRKPSSDKMSN